VTGGEAITDHIVDAELGEPGSYLTVRRGDRVYDRYGWAAGRVVETRITPTRDELFDGLVVDLRGRRLFVDAPEVSGIYDGVVLLGLTVADMTRAACDPAARSQWPGGPPRVPARPADEAATQGDAVSLMAALSRMYVAGRLSVAALEGDVERVLAARTCAELDAIAAELIATPAS
jgi:hypothetical protein